MSIPYADLVKVESHFLDSVKQFDLLIDSLKSPKTLSQEHGEALKCICHYLLRTKDRGLQLRPKV